MRIMTTLNYKTDFRCVCNSLMMKETVMMKLPGEDADW